MPWERKTVDEKRKEFVARAVMGEESISALCREYGISRPTGYKWIERYRNGESMCNRPHTPYSRPFKTSREIELRIMDVRAAHPTWGARKIHRFMVDKGETQLPAVSTVNEILKRNDLISEDLLRRKPLADLDEAQREFDAFRYCYNYERPHAALKLDVPAKHYKPSKRGYIEEPKEPEYDSGRNLRKVNCKGYIAVQKHRYYLSESMIGKYIELRRPTDDLVILAYGNFEVARIDLDAKEFDSRKIYRL